MREIVLQLIETVRPMKTMQLKIDFRSECNTGNACESGLQHEKRILALKSSS